MNTKALIPHFILLLITLTSACFITNCPKSGKRSYPLMNPRTNDIPLRDCMSCGPEGRGQCFGPDICCVEELGCTIKSPESSVCRLEALNPHPCKVSGSSCDAVESGSCASRGLCCNSESCSLDKSCFTRKDIFPLNEFIPWRSSSEYHSEKH